jgi:hypothetical protein
VFRPKAFGLPFTGTSWNGIYGGAKIRVTFLPDSILQLRTECGSTDLSYRIEKPSFSPYEFRFDDVSAASGAVESKPQRCRSLKTAANVLRGRPIVSVDPITMTFLSGSLAFPRDEGKPLNFVIDRKLDKTNKLVGTKWRLVYDASDSQVAETIVFGRDGRMRFPRSCRVWEYRVSGDRLDVAPVGRCTKIKRNADESPIPFPVDRYEITDSDSKLTFFNEVRESASYVRIRK